MGITEQIIKHINSLPERKQSDILKLHQLMLQVMPGCKLWFDDGKNSENRTICNPTIGYGSQILRYADGKTKEFFRIGISANKTGISIYFMGLKDKTALVKRFGDKLGKSKVSGYCIRIKTLSDLNIDILEEAIRYFHPC